jgi:succinyl-diaminopimelate desuccinylase
MADKKRLVRLTRRLIAINSQNPPGDEFQIGLFVKKYLERLGLRPKIYTFAKRRPNVVAVLEAGRQKKSLLVTPHLDTVPCGKNWRFPPLKATIYQNKIYGLGATDCKGNLACGLEAVNSIIAQKATLDYNLVFAATADEESGSRYGLIPLLKKGILHPDAAVVLDSDEFDIVVTQKGLAHIKVKIKGKRAHGAYPWRGVNAIDIAVDVLKELKTRRPFSLRNKYLRPATINIGTIRGGDKVNVVADWCEFELDFRFLPGESEKKILKGIKGILRKHTRKFEIEIEGIQKPYYIEEGHPLVLGLRQAAKKIGVASRVKGSEGATTITFFQSHGIPAVATGYGSSGSAHTVNEYAEIDKLYKGALVLEEFLKNYSFGG